MAAFSISGLASGIDTTSLISQLLTVAAQPQNQLKNQLSTENNVVAAYKAINTKMSAVQTAAEALNSSDTWSAASVASSDTSVVATASPTAAAGSSATFDVTQVARAQTSTFAASSGVVVTGTPPNFTITTGGSTTSITAASGSPAAVAAAINSANVGVRASVVNTDNGPVLQLTSTGTGTANSFTTSGFDPGSQQQDVVSAQDAKISVGDPAAGGYTVSSSTNTFKDVIPGVTFTVSGKASDVTLSLSSDTKSISDKVKALVDSVNAAFTEIGTDTAKGAVLATDQLSTKLQQSLLSVVAKGFSGGSFANFGVTITANGSMTFDADKFANSYSTNPAGTKAALGDALGANFDALSKTATDASTGTISLAVTSDQATADDYTKQISKWDEKLANLQTSLSAKYSAMETALTKLQSESSWLTTTFASINGTSSSSK